VEFNLKYLISQTPDFKILIFWKSDSTIKAKQFSRKYWFYNVKAPQHSFFSKVDIWEINTDLGNLGIKKL